MVLPTQHNSNNITLRAQQPPPAIHRLNNIKILTLLIKDRPCHCHTVHSSTLRLRLQEIDTEHRLLMQLANSSSSNIRCNSHNRRYRLGIPVSSKKYSWPPIRSYKPQPYTVIRPVHHPSTLSQLHLYVTRRRPHPWPVFMALVVVAVVVAAGQTLLLQAAAVTMMAMEVQCITIIIISIRHRRRPPIQVRERVLRPLCLCFFFV